MASRTEYDAVVVGAGPNGLAAAITLAEAGRSVLVLEAADTVGGGARTAELTLPGFHHDVCSAIHALAVSSPLFRRLPLREHGLEWLLPPASLAHPLDGGEAVMLERDVDATAAQLGPDADAYRRLMQPLANGWLDLSEDILGPLRVPRHPLLLARFGKDAVRSGQALAESRFTEQRARALVAGLAAHSILPLDRRPSAAFALALGASAHDVGWPVARGGSQSISDALASYLGSLGGEIVTHTSVTSLSALPRSRVTLLDLTPRQLLDIAREELPAGYRRRLEGYRYGPGVCKIDWALSGPIPWRASACLRAATVHLGGTLEEISEAERAPWEGVHAARPFVLLAQPSLFDESRAPEGMHTAWAYCHVPNGSDRDMTEQIERQVERFAPGFRDLVLARHVMSAVAMETYNPNYVGGDINGGTQDLRQLLTRPVAQRVPYATPAKGLFICSSATPPGGGVHGMCGFFAAKAALRELE